MQGHYIEGTHTHTLSHLLALEVQRLSSLLGLRFAATCIRIGDC